MAEPLVLVTLENHVCHIRLNRPEKRNAANRQMIAELAWAYKSAEDDPEVRALVVSAEGPHFTGGLDIQDVLATADTQGLNLIPEGAVDPWGIATPSISKPVIIAVQGTCLTLGIELILNSEMCIADDDSVFGQIEIEHGIIPFGGALNRLPQLAGRGDAMRWMLTGDKFDVTEAHKMGLVQIVSQAGTALEGAKGLAEKIAQKSPTAIRSIVELSRTTSSVSTEATTHRVEMLVAEQLASRA
jgi:enoyl-CoA hydratase